MKPRTLIFLCVSLYALSGLTYAKNIELSKKTIPDIAGKNVHSNIVNREKFRIIGTDKTNLYDALNNSELHDIWPDGVIITPSSFVAVYDARYETYEETSKIGEQAVEIYNISDPSLELIKTLQQGLSRKYSLTNSDATDADLNLSAKTAYWAIQVQGGKYVLWVNYEIEFLTKPTNTVLASGNCMYMSKAENKNKDIAQWFTQNASQLKEELTKSVVYCDEQLNKKIFKNSP